MIYHLSTKSCDYYIEDVIQNVQIFPESNEVFAFKFAESAQRAEAEEMLNYNDNIKIGRSLIIT